MNYFLVEITKTLDGQVAKALWEKSNMDSALMSLHQGIASAMANANVLEALFQIIDNRGSVYRTEYWSRSAESE